MVRDLPFNVTKPAEDLAERIAPRVDASAADLLKKTARERTGGGGIMAGVLRKEIRETYGRRVLQPQRELPTMETQTSQKSQQKQAQQAAGSIPVVGDALQNALGEGPGNLLLFGLGAWLLLRRN